MIHALCLDPFKTEPQRRRHRSQSIKIKADISPLREEGGYLRLRLGEAQVTALTGPRLNRDD